MTPPLPRPLRVHSQQLTVTLTTKDGQQRRFTFHPRLWRRLSDLTSQAIGLAQNESQLFAFDYYRALEQR